MKGLSGVEDQLGMQLVQTADQVLEIVLDPDQGHLVPPLAQRVGDLVLHLGLVVLPGGHLLGHLAGVVLVVPAVVGGVEDYGDAHAAPGSGGKRPQSWPGPVGSGRGAAAPAVRERRSG